jgi:predicted transporter
VEWLMGYALFVLIFSGIAFIAGAIKINGSKETLAIAYMLAGIWFTLMGILITLTNQLCKP